MSLKPFLNVCLRSWLKPNRSFINNFIRTEPFISGCNLFHSLMTLGMKESLKYSDLQETIF